MPKRFLVLDLATGTLDEAVSAALDSEAADRSAADTNLKANLNAEAAARVAGDDALQTLIDALSSTGNLLYVDALTGNNGTAARNDPSKPFLTGTAAETAASSGDTIVVRAGTYTDAGGMGGWHNLGKDGVNYVLLGATIILNDTAATSRGCRSSGTTRAKPSRSTGTERSM